MKKYFWLIVALVVLAAWGINARRKATTYDIHLSWPNLTEETSVSLRLVKKSDPDTPLHETHGPAGRGQTFPLDKAIDPGELAVQLDTPEGWVPCEFEKSVRTTRDFDFRLKAGMAQLWVDNLGGPGGEIVCGKFRFPLQANDKAHVTFPRPLVKAVPLLLGEKRVGEIPPFDGKDTLLTDAGYLLDCTGKHRYLHESFVYEGDKGIPGNVPLGGSKTHFDGSQLHPLPSPTVDYFLERAPKAIQLKTYGPVLVREQRIRYMLVRE
jgi:hypothetical protein